MISTTLKDYWLYRNDAVVVLDWNILLKFGFEKRGILTKFHFYIKRSMEISGKGLLHFFNKHNP